MNPPPVLLSVHAVDNLGEEGILSDAAVGAELRCRSIGVVTAVLATRSDRVEALQSLSLAMVAQQFEAVISRCRPAAARTGILRGARQVRLVAELLRGYAIDHLVVAPVPRVGDTRILDDETFEATRTYLYPLARVLVARAGDLRSFAAEPADDIEGMKRAAATLRAQGARAVLVSGVVSRGRVLDLLDDEGRIGLFDTSRVSAPRIGGLSGAHAAALAAHLARGRGLPAAAEAAQRYVGFRLQRGR